jgi:hypothetical protein
VNGWILDYMKRERKGGLSGKQVFGEGLILVLILYS